MHHKHFLPGLAAFALAHLALFAQVTAFTYQGRLAENGNPASGAYEFRFVLFDAASSGLQIGPPLTNTSVAVSGGLFTALLDFGAGAFSGANRWLEIGARTNGSVGAFTTLNPRQLLTSTPYAFTAGEVTSANIARLNPPNTAVQATGTPVVTSGFITSANVVNGGSGYITPPVVTVNDTTGSGAAITANISNGSVVSFTVQNTGSGHSANATLTVAPPPSNASQVFAGLNYFNGANFLTNGSNVISGNGAGLKGVNRLDAADGSPAPALSVDNNGRVAIGTNAANHQLRISNVGANGPFWTSQGWYGAIELDNVAAIGWHNNGAAAFGIGQTFEGLRFFRCSSDPGNIATAPLYDMVINNDGRVGIGQPSPNFLLQVQLAICNGTQWINASDRNQKEHFAPVDSRDVLKKLIALPIQSWNYTNDASERHIGPVAQDFHTAFSLNGTNETHISTVDADGVALAAIQGLNQKLEDELKRRDAENATLKERLTALEQLIKSLPKKFNGGER